MNKNIKATRSIKGKTFLKECHVDIPLFNAFKESGFPFILACVQIVDDRFKYQFERKDEQGEVVGLELRMDKIEPPIESWGIELRPCKTDNRDFQTTLFYRRLVPEQAKDCDTFISMLFVTALSTIRNNLDSLVDALEDETVKRKLDKKFIYDILDKMIKSF